MRKRWWFGLIFFNAWFAAAGWGATFGKVVPAGGHASDLALDETRGLLYVANFTANRIEVMSLADGVVRSSINVAVQPASLALSRDGRFLLVAHFGNYRSPDSPRNGLTLIELASGGKQTFALSSPPLGVAFASSGRALVVTSAEFLLFDPISESFQLLDTVKDVTANTLPAPPSDFPPQIIAASVAASADGTRIYGLTDTIRFRYEVLEGRVISLGYTATPPMGPRVVSVSRDGAYYTAGWGLFDYRGTLLAQFSKASGLLNVGSHAIDSEHGLIYAQIPESEGSPPVLMIADADNLTVRERMQLPENLAGKSVLSADGKTMYSISDSGVMILPVGSYEKQPRLAVSAEDVFFQTGLCRPQDSVQEIRIEDPSGGATDFAISSSLPGIKVWPASGVTPATVKVQADPNGFLNRKGTIEGRLDIQSYGAVNLPPPVRVLLNLREPDQRGTLHHVPGKLVDLLADPIRNRIYILRQDRNEALVYDSVTYQLVKVLRTGNTPSQMAITSGYDRLLVANENSQIASVFNLETLEPESPVRFPPGHYPRSIAASGRAILAASRVAGPDHTIDRVDLRAQEAVQLPSLGVWENKIDENTMLAAAPNGASILVVQANGRVQLYDAGADTFTLSRKDFTSLKGAYAASSYGYFVVDNHLLNSSLVPAGQFDKGSGVTTGAAFLDQTGFLTTVPTDSSPGVIQRLDPVSGAGLRPTRLAEAPPAGSPGSALTRTVAALWNRSAVITLTTSGFTVLPWDYDASTAPPKLEQVVNAADFTEGVAPGGLITVFGKNLSGSVASAGQMPLPVILGETCLTANGVPAPMLYVSPGQINAQLPYEADGSVSVAVHAPGGMSDNYNLTVVPAAPAVFRSGVAGPVQNIPTVIRAANNMLATAADPLHLGDIIVIYLTGLGRTSPPAATGAPAPYTPLAEALIPPAVTLGNVSLPVSYAGLTPGLAGVYQINTSVSISVPTGLNVPLTITQGGKSTSFSVRVVN